MALPASNPRNARVARSDPPPPLSAPVPSAPAAAPPFRLRKLLALAIGGLVAWGLYPRAKAAWELHTQATTLADYALCMAGPTGPSLLRDNPGQFKRLVRRRLIYSAADERPFERCAEGALELTGSKQVERAHRETAWSFVEYGGPASEATGTARRAAVSTDDLAVTTRPLAELARESWPFVRDGWTHLVRPSLGAHEATHPVDLPRPAVGRGLPAWRARYRALHAARGALVLAVGRGANLSVYRSSDGGVNWAPASVREPGLASFAERCSAEDGVHSFTFATSDDGRRTLVTSLGPDGAPQSADLAPTSLTVVSAACDEDALVAALSPSSSREVTLALCPYRKPCQAMTLPAFQGVGARPLLPLDVARLDGTTILAVTMHGIVRVASTRDDGRSWTPFSVAFDPDAHPEVRTRVQAPVRLLAMGKHVLLYGGSNRPADTYPVLISDDLGAAWRTP